jgi:hypothetical protein
MSGWPSLPSCSEASDAKMLPFGNKPMWPLAPSSPSEASKDVESSMPKVSGPSGTASARTGTSMTLWVSPGAKERSCVSLP